MDILILCMVALLATVAAWLYLSNRKATLEQTDDAAADAGEGTADQAVSQTPAAETPAESEKAGFLKEPSTKDAIFLAIMLIGLWAMAFALELIYKNNTLLENLRLIVLLAILFIAAKVDAKERIIPNPLVLFGLVARVGFWVAELIATPDTFLTIVKDDLMACLLVVVFFIIGVVLIKDGLGMGDVKLMLVMCLFQGFYGVVSSLFFALFVAFIYAIIALFMKKKSRKDSVAFAPAILLGTMFSIFLTGM